MSDVLLEAAGLRKIYHDGSRELKVLAGVDFHIAAGETVAVVGRSGTGKSTLLNCLGLLDRPSEGEVRIRGEAASRLSDAKRTRLRGRFLGFVFQRYHLLPDLDALENVEMAGHLAGCPDSKRAGELLDLVGLSDRTSHRPRQLSGGEQQRVAIARALMPGPAVLLCDEPTGNLDPHTGSTVMDVLWKAVAEKQTAMVMVTHDEQVARRAGRVVHLEDGRLRAR